MIAEPVMKPLTAGAGMNSTIHPSRKRPIPRTVKPCERLSGVWYGERARKTYRDEGHGGGNLWACPSFGVGSLHVLDDLRYGQGHDGDGTDRHILGGGKELGGG